MAVHYHLVLRKDMTKGAAEDSKLYYAQTSASGMNDLKQMCENIAARTTASEGDVKLVLNGFIAYNLLPKKPALNLEIIDKSRLLPA